MLYHYICYAMVTMLRHGYTMLRHGYIATIRHSLSYNTTACLQRYIMVTINATPWLQCYAMVTTLLYHAIVTILHHAYNATPWLQCYGPGYNATAMVTTVTSRSWSHYICNFRVIFVTSQFSCDICIYVKPRLQLKHAIM